MAYQCRVCGKHMEYRAITCSGECRLAMKYKPSVTTGDDTDSGSVTATSVTDNHKCRECGCDLNAKRSDAKYCGANCRKRASRRRDQIKREAWKAGQAMRDMARIAGDDVGLNDLAFDQISKIYKELTRVRVTVAGRTKS